MEIPQRVTAVRTVFARRLRELREAEDITLDALAERLRGAGWPTVAAATLAKAERGEYTLTFGHLTLLARVLGVRPEAFLPGSDIQVGLPLGFNVRTATLRQMFRDTMRAEPPAGSPRVTAILDPAKEAARSAAERRAASKLGLRTYELAELAVRKWGHGLTVQRDKEAGAGASPAARRLVTQELLKQLREELSHDT